MADEMSQNESVEIEQSIASLSSMHWGKLGVCTCKMNEVKALLADGDDLESINQCLETFLFHLLNSRLLISLCKSLILIT